jgi:tRNA (guanine10-N2)-dimethyltransferase
MIPVLIELAGGNPLLGAAELAGALEAIGGRLLQGPAEGTRLARAELPDRRAIEQLGHRLALARRLIEPPPDDAGVELERLLSNIPAGTSASFRPLASRSGGPLPAMVERWIAAWKRQGGRIDLDAPDHRFLYVEGPRGTELLGEELVRIDGRALRARRMPRLPFQRPVSLSPPLARSLVNLAAVRDGERVVDPFVGTGALLVESALLGARVVGIDRDPTMIRGALRNLAYCGCEAETLLVDDAATAAGRFPAGTFDALVTDPPYGRASATDGEAPAVVLARTLAAWSDRLAQGGRIALAHPGGPDPIPPGWTCAVDVPDRVHRSLTRHFTVYRRRDAPTPGRPRAN